MDRVQIAALIFAGGSASTKSPSTPDDPRAPIAGRSLLGWVVEAAVGASVRRVAIVGDEPSLAARAEMARRTDNTLVEFVAADGLDGVDVVALAVERLGGELAVNDNAHILILSEGAPQVTAEELRGLVAEHLDSDAAMTLLGETAAHSGGEPVVMRSDDGLVTSIVEPLTDWSDETVTIACVRAPLLGAALRRATPRGWGGAPLFREAAAALHEAGHLVVELPRPEPVTQVSSAVTRVAVEAELRDRVMRHWLERGVIIQDPRQVSIDATVTIGKGVRILPGTLLEGSTEVGDGAVVGPNSQIVDATIGAGAVAAHVVVRDCDVPVHSTLEPFTVVGPKEPG